MLIIVLVFGIKLREMEIKVMKIKTKLMLCKTTSI